MKLIIIRHGDPDYSIDSLTEAGWRRLLTHPFQIKKQEGYYAL